MKVQNLMEELVARPIGKISSKLKTDFQISMDCQFSDVRCYEYKDTEFYSLISDRFKFSYKAIQLGTIMRKKQPEMFDKYYNKWMSQRRVA